MQEHADYHNHTYLCGHATGEAEEYVLQAVKLGLPEIGFAEHIPMYWLPEAGRDPEIAMPEAEFEGYVRTVLDLKSRYPEIGVRLGVEADYIPGFEARLQALLVPYPWDYVYGSVHYVGDWGFDNPAHAHRYAEWEIYELYEKYFALVCEAARTGLFDVIGHLDVIKKWGHRPPTLPAGLYARVSEELARAGVVVEANTAGYRKPARELYPAPDLLRELIRRGVDFTLGSDAHAPEEVGYGFAGALHELNEAGCTTLVRFRHRARTPVPLCSPEG